MRTLYTTRREDFFSAWALGQITNEMIILSAGSIWIDLCMTEAEAAAYTFPITKA